MLIIFLGPPGSGKGTQSKIVASKLAFKHVSTGDMLREVAKSQTLLGKELNEVMKTGGLVTDSMVNEIVAETLRKEEYKNGCILDGYPRTLSQASFLETVNTDNYAVIYLKINKDKLSDRIESRFVCNDCGAIFNKILSPLKHDGKCDKCQGGNFKQRADDNLDALKARIDAFEDQIAMILDFYRQRKKLAVIEADKTVDEVTKLILESIKKH